MAADEFITQSIPIGATLAYTYGADSLLKLGLSPNGDRKQVTMTFFVPSCDAEIIVQDYENHALQIADLKSWYSEHARITSLLKSIKHRGENTWCSSAWINGVNSRGEKIK
jgi:hypothetical protein